MDPLRQAKIEVQRALERARRCEHCAHFHRL